MANLLRAAPFTSVLLASELFLVTAPIIVGIPLVTGLWRLFSVPAYALVTLAVWLTPWNNHWTLALTVLAVLGFVDWALRRSDAWRPRP